MIILKRSQAFLLGFFIIVLSSCQVGRMVWYNFAGIKDYRIFPKRELKHEGNPFHFTEVKDTARLVRTITYNGKKQDLDHFLRKSNTVAFIVIRNDSMLYENYFGGYDRASVVASFSMAKSFTSMLIGCAVADSLIPSVKDPITNYLPELRPELKKVTIEHLLQMTSGIKFNESYVNPFGEAAKYYYGTNLRKYIKKLHLQDEPGTVFHYTSGNTQLLGMILERALKNKTVTQYFQEKIWGPLGMEYDASWSIDREKNGMEKTFCCVNACARDYAKIGRLYCNGGKWGEKQLVPADWVNNTCKCDLSNGGVDFYHYQWWLASKEDGDYFANGVQGQYIYVNPAKKIVIVRLGRNHGHVHWKTVFREFAAELK